MTILAQALHQYPFHSATSTFRRFFARVKKLLPKLKTDQMDFRFRIHREGHSHQFTGTMQAALPHEILTVHFSSPTFHQSIRRATKLMLQRLKKYKSLHFLPSRNRSNKYSNDQPSQISHVA